MEREARNRFEPRRSAPFKWTNGPDFGTQRQQSSNQWRLVASLCLNLLLLVAVVILAYRIGVIEKRVADVEKQPPKYTLRTWETPDGD